MEIYSAETIDESICRALWKIRLEYLELGQTVCHEEDWQKFRSALMQGDRRIVVFRDKSKTLQGFYVNAYDTLEVEGRRALCMSTKYTYLHPALRGRPTMMTSGFRLYLETVQRFGLMPTFMVGVTFPNSYIFVHATLGRIWTLQEPQIPEFERALLTKYAKAKTSSFDESRGLVFHPNRPPSLSSGVKGSPELGRLYAKYQRLNPKWRDGWAMPLIGRVGLRTASHAAKRMVRRAARTIR